MGAYLNVDLTTVYGARMARDGQISGIGGSTLSLLLSNVKGSRYNSTHYEKGNVVMGRRGQVPPIKIRHNIICLKEMAYL